MLQQLFLFRQVSGKDVFLIKINEMKSPQMALLILWFLIYNNS